MSMKFFTGLQDFLGLYDSSSASNNSSSEQQQQQEQQQTSPSPAAALTASSAPSSSSESSAHSANLNSTDSEENSCNNISVTISSSANSTEQEQQQQQQQQEQQFPGDLAQGDSKGIEDNADEKIRRCSHGRNVHFPETVVTDFYDAPTIIFTDKHFHDISTIHDAYVNACRRLKIEPIKLVQQQIACFHQVPGIRQECLNLIGFRLTSADMDSFEEIFKKVQFDMLNFEYTFLDDDSAVCLAEMLEYYDSAQKLNVSFNKQISTRGWLALFKAVNNAPSLQYLDLRYTSLSDRAVPLLARTLRVQPSLTVLHLENVSLAGRNLIIVGCALKENTVLRELYLGDNNLQPADGAHIYQLIITNVSIQLLDLRNNQLQDGGLRHICDALKHRDTAKNSALSALVVWNNKITSAGMEALAQALKENSKLETLNIGNNNLSSEGIAMLKPALQQNCSLQRLGLQATNLDCQGAIVLAECLADNKIMVRLDLRDNSQIGSAGLLALHLAMKMNTSITLLNLDISVTKSSSAKVKEYQEQFKVYYEEIKTFCERNKQIALKKLSVQTTVQEGTATAVEKHDSGDEEKEQKVQEEKEKSADAAVSEPGDAEVKRNLLASKKSANAIWLLSRSSSLTCAETIDDIPERVAQMSRSLSMIEEIPDSVTTIKKHTVDSHPALFAKSELSKTPSLPLITAGDSAAKANPQVTSISRRFTVSTSSLSVANPRDVARARSRFKVERVGSSIQKTAKAKSDDCIVLHRSLSESCADDSQAPEFLATEGATLKGEILKVKQPEQLFDAVISALVESEDSSGNLGSQGDGDTKMKQGDENRPEDSGSHADGGVSGSFRSQNGEKNLESTIPQDVQEKRGNFGSKSTEELSSESLEDAEIPSPGPGSVCLQSSAVAVMQQEKGAHEEADSSSDVNIMTEISEDFALRREGEKCTTSKKHVCEKNSIELTVKAVGSDGKDVPKNASETKNSAASPTTQAESQDLSTDEYGVQEVVRDLVTYVAYEIGDDSTVHCRKSSTMIGNKDGSPAYASSSSASRSSSSPALNSSDDMETEEEVIRGVVRGLVRDVLLHEKEILRRSLRKKRQRLGTMPKIDRH